MAASMTHEQLLSLGKTLSKLVDAGDCSGVNECLATIPADLDISSVPFPQAWLDSLPSINKEQAEALLLLGLILSTLTPAEITLTQAAGHKRTIPVVKTPFIGKFIRLLEHVFGVFPRGKDLDRSAMAAPLKFLGDERDHAPTTTLVDSGKVAFFFSRIDLPFPAGVDGTENKSNGVRVFSEYNTRTSRRGNVVPHFIFFDTGAPPSEDLGASYIEALPFPCGPIDIKTNISDYELPALMLHAAVLFARCKASLATPANPLFAGRA